MSRVSAIKQQIKTQSSAELTAFRSWYAAFDAQAWRTREPRQPHALARMIHDGSSRNR